MTAAEANLFSVRIPKGRELPERMATPERAYFNRRKFLERMGMAAGVAAATRVGLASTLPSTLLAAEETPKSPYPAPRNAKFTLDRPITAEKVATRYNNFAEFTHQKEAVWLLVDKFQIEPWTIKVRGLVNKPQTIDVHKLIREMPLEERLYRHRCIEAWSMAVPWTGFPFRKLIEMVEPRNDARYVRMLSFYRPDQAQGQQQLKSWPWPDREALTMQEAMNDLAFMVTGLYGKPIPKQNGAPIRIALPWKYGFKSLKSIEVIEFTDQQPQTFWHEIAPTHHDFYANVDPRVPHPQWSQETERDIETGERRKTILYNGYGDHVAHMYARR